MAKNNDIREGYLRLLDAWDKPHPAAKPIGCLATSFTFDSVFFEEECLGRFVGLETNSQEQELTPQYVIEREEKLSQLKCAAVLVDEHHSRGPRSLRWDLLPAKLGPHRIMHAKIFLLCWQDWIRLGIGSANLTEPGYRLNREVIGVLDYHKAGRFSRKVIVDTLAFLEELAPESGGVEGKALERWTSLIDWARTRLKDWPEPDTTGHSNKAKVSAIFSGLKNKPVLDQLVEIWKPWSPPSEIFVVSPFFDQDPGDNLPARRLWEILKQRGEATVYFWVPGAKLAEKEYRLLAPESLLKAQPSSNRPINTVFRCVLEEEENEKGPRRRPLHAKMISFEDNDHCLTLEGSSNFTRKGLGMAKGQNANNVEANLAYIQMLSSEKKEYKLLGDNWPARDEVETEWIQWQSAPNDDEDAGSPDFVALPPAFSTAVFLRRDGKSVVRIELKGQAPEGWEVLHADKDRVLAKSGQPLARGGIEIEWNDPAAPSALRLRWQGSEGVAWLPVNLDAQDALPPPEELRDLPLEVLIEVLTSASPLHVALARWIKREHKKDQEDGVSGELDPHKRVDVSGFLLQRTRRVSWALEALRARLSKPVLTQEALDWRLHGPVGVEALAKAIIREAGDKADERLFLIAELCLELSWVKPETIKCGVAEKETKKALLKCIQAFEKESLAQLEGVDAGLRQYVKDAFSEANHE